MRRYLIETYGCQMNVAEAEAMRRDLNERDWMETTDPVEADVVILHTCSVRKTAEERIVGRIGYYTHLKKNDAPRLVVSGCMAERMKDRLISEQAAVDMLVGTHGRHLLAEEIESFTRRKRVKEIIAPPQEEFRFSALHYGTASAHAYIPIMHGCDNFCTYCIVPHVRGREVSRDPDEIFNELERAAQNGIREVCLLGQNVNSYRHDCNGTLLDFTGLLESILERNESIEWFRFLTSHPKDVAPGLIDLLANEDRLCNHFHLPVQHGSNKILRAMNRKYRREDFLEIVETLRDKVPDISITTDILVGFPGEREEDFAELLSLLDAVGFDDAFTYYYNSREGTPAADFTDQVPHEIKLERLSQIIDIQRRKTVERRSLRLGKVVKVLTDAPAKKGNGMMRGHTERDEPVVYRGTEKLIGSFVTVRLEELSGFTYRASILDQVQAKEG